MENYLITLNDKLQNKTDESQLLFIEQQQQQNQQISMYVRYRLSSITTDCIFNLFTYSSSISLP